MYVSLSAPVPLPPRHGMPKLTDSPDMIDKHTYEIRQDEDKVVYKSLEEVGDDLPDHAPRFVLLSHPLTMVRPIEPTPTYTMLTDLG